MTIEKRVPMAGMFSKLNSEDFVEKEDVVSVDGDGWSITVSKKIVDTLGEDVVRNSVASMLKVLSDIVDSKEGDDSEQVENVLVEDKDDDKDEEND